MVGASCCSGTATPMARTGRADSCSNPQDLVALIPRDCGLRTLDRDWPRRSDKAEVSGSGPLRPTPTVASQLDFHGWTHRPELA